MTTQKSALTPTAAAEILGIAPNTLRAAGRADGITLGGRVVRPVIIGCRQSWPAAPILAWAEGRDEA